MRGKYAIQWMRKARLPSRPRTLVSSSARISGGGVCELCRVLLLFVVVDFSVRVLCAVWLLSFAGIFFHIGISKFF